jgi:uncharacterized protein
MLAGLILSALLLGLAGGAHCVAMCGGVCHALTRDQPHGWSKLGSAVLGLHAGRMFSYAGLGALAGSLLQSMAWASEHVVLFKPLWVLLHASILAWGLMLLVLARQPQWLARATQPVWQKIQWAGRSTWRSALFGTGWALLPCGLLYSALLLASLSGGAWQGAVVMLAFSLPTILWLLGVQWAAKSVQILKLSAHQAWGRRLAGLMLTLGAAWALWQHMVHGINAIC